MSSNSIKSRLDKIYGRLKGEFTRASLNERSQKNLSQKEVLKLLVAAITAAVSDNKKWLRSEDAALMQSIVPGQDTTIDLA